MKTGRRFHMYNQRIHALWKLVPRAPTELLKLSQGLSKCELLQGEYPETAQLFPQELHNTERKWLDQSRPECDLAAHLWPRTHLTALA